MDEKTARKLNFIIKIAYMAVIAVLIYICFKYVAKWVLPFILAFIIASAMHPVIRWLTKKWKIESSIISLIIMAFVYVLFAAIIFAIVSNSVFYLQSIILQMPSYFEQSILPTFTSIGEDISNFINDMPEEWGIQLSNSQKEIMSYLQSVIVKIPQIGISFVSNFTSGIPTFLITLVFTIMLSFFISMQYDDVTAFLRNQIPEKFDILIKNFKFILRDTVGRYFKSALTLMAITSVEVSIGLTVLGVKNSIIFGIVIAVFDALPFFGTGAILIPWLIISLIRGNYTLALGLLMLYGIVTVVRYLIEPKILSKKLGISPIVTLVAVYLGFRTFGVLGMIFMPLCAQILIALQKSGSIKVFKASSD